MQLEQSFALATTHPGINVMLEFGQSILNFLKDIKDLFFGFAQGF